MTPHLYMGFGHPGPGLSRIVKIGTDVNPQNIFCFELFYDMF